jgi:hypothetical protein
MAGSDRCHAQGGVAVPLDAEVSKAVYAVIAAAGQPKQLSDRLCAWLNAMSERDLSAEEQARHLELVREAVIVKAQGD